jgi:hypothetical protein
MTDRMILRDASQDPDYDCHLMFRFLYRPLAPVTVGRNWTKANRKMLSESEVESAVPVIRGRAAAQWAGRS